MQGRSSSERPIWSTPSNAWRRACGASSGRLTSDSSSTCVYRRRWGTVCSWHESPSRMARYGVCRVLACVRYWLTLVRSHTVRAGVHGEFSQTVLKLIWNSAVRWWWLFCMVANSNILFSWGRMNACNSLCWCGLYWMLCYWDVECDAKLAEDFQWAWIKGINCFVKYCESSVCASDI